MKTALIIGSRRSLARYLVLESPARRAVRLGRGVPDGGVESEAVEVPGRRAGARGAVRGREGVALDLHRPAALPAARSHPLQGRPIGYPDRLAFEDDVDGRQPGGDRAGRIRGQIAGLARPRSAREIDVAVEPEGTDPGGVGAAVRPRRAEEGRAAEEDDGREEIVRPAPRQRGVAVDVEILGLNRCSIGHRYTSF